LWGSRVWTRGEKLVGTLIVPGEFGTSLFLVQRSVEPAGDEDTFWETVLGVVTLTAPLAVVAVTVLAIRMRQRARAVRDWPQATGVV